MCCQTLSLPSFYPKFTIMSRKESPDYEEGTPLGITLNRKDRRQINKLVNRIDRPAARRELVQMACARSCTLAAEGETDGGKAFAVYIDPHGIRYGEMEMDGFAPLTHMARMGAPVRMGRRRV